MHHFARQWNRLFIISATLLAPLFSWHLGQWNPFGQPLLECGGFGWILAELADESVAQTVIENGEDQRRTRCLLESFLHELEKDISTIIHIEQLFLQQRPLGLLCGRETPRDHLVKVQHQRIQHHARFFFRQDALEGVLQIIQIAAQLGAEKSDYIGPGIEHHGLLLRRGCHVRLRQRPVEQSPHFGAS